MTRKILIANRGEIALRIMRTAREAGLATVAVYSEADRDALHVRSADEAYPIGPAPAAESYLRIDRILEAANRSGASAVHPGYGFLAENAEFAAAVEAAGLTFIGPPARSIAAMGDKIEARGRAARAGLAVTPASPVVESAQAAREAARTVGYPALLKARAGGGGKGMRKVERPEEMEEAFRLARSEARKAFRNDELYLERFVEEPRHIEVQVFADAHGNVVALGDRECSIQRRHQKIVEEAPAPHLSEETRRKMGEAACAVARAVGYRSAGTVEFLVDPGERFYFLEMNTRLQVEHPVTEWVTGLDLVAWQLAVAQGKPLPALESPAARGHAVEARIYAEDPANHFFPSPGKIRHLRWPSGPGIRIDSGVEAGCEISLYYDPLIAKLSVWAETRASAVERLRRALAETRIGGPVTNLAFLRAIAGHPQYADGRVSTLFIARHAPFALPEPDEATADSAIAAAALYFSGRTPLPAPRADGGSAWWRAGLPRERASR